MTTYGATQRKVQVLDVVMHVCDAHELMTFTPGCPECRKDEAAGWDFAKIIKYPQEWDTAAYPSLSDAIREILLCSQAANGEKDD